MHANIRKRMSAILNLSLAMTLSSCALSSPMDPDPLSIELLSAHELNRTEDREEYLALAEKVRKNYNEKLLACNPETGRYSYRLFSEKDTFTSTQAALAMPLILGMVPEERKEDIIESLRLLLEKDQCLRTGEVGQPYIIRAMNQYGMNDLLYNFISRPEHPSYYAFILAGETTLGEYWEDNPRSHCHDMMGHIVEWFYNGIAGIEPVSKGFESVKIHPFMPEGINEFTCSYPTPHGTIEVKGHRENGIPEFEYSVPETIRIIA